MTQRLDGNPIHSKAHARLRLGAALIALAVGRPVLPASLGYGIGPALAKGGEAEGRDGKDAGEHGRDAGNHDRSRDADRAVGRSRAGVERASIERTERQHRERRESARAERRESVARAANLLGRLNPAQASPTAMTHASPNSAVGALAAHRTEMRAAPARRDPTARAAAGALARPDLAGGHNKAPTPGGGGRGRP